MAHIQATPGFAGRSWPHAMTLAENLADLATHARDFAERRGFTYTVLGRPTGDVIGCVYIYPAGTPGGAGASDPTEPDASVRSWVTASHAQLDRPLRLAVSDWLWTEWPFERVAYAARP